MGYTTNFKGAFKTDRPVDEETYHRLKGLNETRRMSRKIIDPQFGIEGEFYCGYDETDDDPSIIDCNVAPRTQPSLWCGWKMLEDHQTIEWDEVEKFYSYTEWVQYIIERVLMPKGYYLEGVMVYSGERTDDAGRIDVTKDAVTVTDVYGHKKVMELVCNAERLQGNTKDSLELRKMVKNMKSEEES